jgi:hypothetical protein
MQDAECEPSHWRDPFQSQGQCGGGGRGGSLCHESVKIISDWRAAPVLSKLRRSRRSAVLNHSLGEECLLWTECRAPCEERCHPGGGPDPRAGVSVAEMIQGERPEGSSSNKERYILSRNFSARSAKTLSSSSAASSNRSSTRLSVILRSGGSEEEEEEESGARPVSDLYEGGLVVTEGAFL